MHKEGKFYHVFDPSHPQLGAVEHVSGVPDRGHNYGGQMLTPTRYVVAHKRGPKEPTEYFGPFVSQTLAERFMDTKFPEKEGERTWMRPLANPRELSS
jgi:hypothetical protein